MKWEKLKPPEPDDPMCCCECDIYQYGCCCDCEDLDEAFNSWIPEIARSCENPACQDSSYQFVSAPKVVQPVSVLRGTTCSCGRGFKCDDSEKHLWNQLLSNKLWQLLKRWLRDRPSKCGYHSAVLGAMIDNLEISMIPALVLLPLLLRVAALHYLLGIIILTALPGLVLWYYYATHKKRRRTLFFLTLSLYSLFYMYYLFITEILPRGDVSQLQLCAVTTGMIFTIVSLIQTKRGPGLVTTSPHEAHSHGQEPDKDSACRNGSIQSAASSSGTAAAELQATKAALTAKWSRCPLCKVMRPPRAGHCRTCGSCVLRLDHHCIWINSCVGQANHRSFLLTLSVFVLTSLYGISLVLRSLCPRQYLMTALLYCPAVYTHSSTALCFTCAWYSSIVTAGLFYLLVTQVLNISFNVTERESRLALRNKTGQSRLWGLVIDTGEYSRGFCQNWVEFLTMADASPSPRSSLPDLV